jgi:hypothetical protein
MTYGTKASHGFLSLLLTEARREATSYADTPSRPHAVTLLQNRTLIVPCTWSGISG